MKKQLIEYLKTFVMDERFAVFENILRYRTKYITLVLEDIFQAQNASAVLRSCDCFGIQSIHVIENRFGFEVDSQVDMGASKWLDITKYNKSKNNTEEALSGLKKQGYRIIATTPHRHDVSPETFDIEKGPFALVFGTEKTGLSKTAISLADEYLRIPMFGFTESFNISVSAALLLRTFITKLHTSSVNWKLSEDEKDEILHRWLVKSIRAGKKIEENYIKTMSGKM